MNQLVLAQHHVFSHMKLDPLLECHQEYLLCNARSLSLPEKIENKGGIDLSSLT